MDNSNILPKTPEYIQEKQNQFDNRRRKIEYWSIALFILCWIGIGFLIYLKTGNLISAFVITILLGYILLTIVNSINNYIISIWAPEYVIDESDDTVLRLHGAVKFTEMDLAKKRLLACREGYMIVDDAFEKYGCTFAAIPETQEHRMLKQKLAELGVTLY
ncbi:MULTISPECIES: hypothetical protein [unclassified Methylobacter]|jgi:hypothetical protein|uniref:hypothetical protein n=1 Tax=unclassified Methylobacter TaxID=2635283 RepID=UPI001894351F|nr:MULTISPECIES: hypothetical protein [unclassified Methylobacter]MBF6649180.1 hypothetical protein [Methylobacter sp. BlB1]WAK04351.1 hypothetical protein LZ558_22040 [Methylobacter sp. YRD-M1]